MKAMKIMTTFVFMMFIGMTSHAANLAGTYYDDGAVKYFEVYSQDTGDKIIYWADAKSKVGKVIGEVCYDTLSCSVVNVKVNKKEKKPTKKVGDASAYFEITGGEPFLSSGTEQTYKTVSTQHGDVKIGKDGVILVNNKKAFPALAMDNVKIVWSEDDEEGTEKILFQGSSGNACPALFAVMTSTKKRIDMTPVFGTCSDVYNLGIDDNGNLALRTIDMDAAQDDKKVIHFYTVKGKEVSEFLRHLKN